LHLATRRTVSVESIITIVARNNCIDTASCTLLSSLTDRAIRAAILPYVDPLYHEDATLSQRTVGMPEFNELMDMARLLVNLWEAAQRLPEGSERRDALRQISGYQRRVAALVTRAL
jgi:hypothetical protein